MLSRIRADLPNPCSGIGLDQRIRVTDLKSVQISSGNNWMFGTLSFYRGMLLDFKNIPAVTRVFTGIAEFGIFLETTEQNDSLPLLGPGGLAIFLFFVFFLCFFFEREYQYTRVPGVPPIRGDEEGGVRRRNTSGAYFLSRGRRFARGYTKY